MNRNRQSLRQTTLHRLCGGFYTHGIVFDSCCWYYSPLHCWTCLLRGPSSNSAWYQLANVIGYLNSNKTNCKLNRFSMALKSLWGDNTAIDATFHHLQSVLSAHNRSNQYRYCMHKQPCMFWHAVLSHRWCHSSWLHEITLLLTDPMWITSGYLHDSEMLSFKNNYNATFLWSARKELF